MIKKEIHDTGGWCGGKETDECRAKNIQNVLYMYMKFPNS